MQLPKRLRNARNCICSSVTPAIASQGNASLCCEVLGKLERYAPGILIAVEGHLDAIEPHLDEILQRYPTPNPKPKPDPNPHPYPIPDANPNPEP